jgi:hypothetical protein
MKHHIRSSWSGALWLSAFCFLLSVFPALAQPTPTAAATQTEVNAGTVPRKYVSPATLAGWTSASATNLARLNSNNIFTGSSNRFVGSVNITSNVWVGSTLSVTGGSIYGNASGTSNAVDLASGVGVAVTTNTAGRTFTLSTALTNSTDLPGVIVGAGVGTNITTLPTLAGDNIFSGASNRFTGAANFNAALWATNLSGPSGGSLSLGTGGTPFMIVNGIGIYTYNGTAYYGDGSGLTNLPQAAITNAIEYFDPQVWDAVKANTNLVLLRSNAIIIPGIWQGGTEPSPVGGAYLLFDTNAWLHGFHSDGVTLDVYGYDVAHTTFGSPLFRFGISGVNQSMIALNVEADLTVAGHLNVTSNLNVTGAASYTSLGASTLTITNDWDASGATNANATTVFGSGTVPDARLASNVVRSNAPTIHDPTIIGTLTATQFNIGSVTVTNTISGSNFVASAGYIGDGSSLSNLTGANVASAVPDATRAVYVTTSPLTNIVTDATRAVYVTTSPLSNSISGNATTADTSTLASYVSGALTNTVALTSNIQAGATLNAANGAALTNLAVTGSQVTLSGWDTAFLWNNAGGIDLTFDGGGLTNLTGANVTGTVPSSTGATYATNLTDGANILAGTVPEARSHHTLTNLNTFGTLGLDGGAGYRYINAENVTNTYIPVQQGALILEPAYGLTVRGTATANGATLYGDAYQTNSLTVAAGSTSITNTSAASQGVVFGPSSATLSYGGANTLFVGTKVGIGTATPGTNVVLHALSPVLRLSDNRNTTWVTGDYFGGLQCFTADTSDVGTPHSVAEINFLHTTANSTTPSVGITFSTTGAGYTSEERVRIDASGNFGINTTFPTNTIQVHGTAQITGNTYFGGTSNHFAGITKHAAAAYFGAGNEANIDDNGVFTGNAYLELSATDAIASVTNTTAGNARLAAATNSGVAELYAVDDAGTYTQLSSHPSDAPVAFYVTTNWAKIAPKITRSFNVFSGQIEWANETLSLLLRKLELRGTNISTLPAGIRTRIAAGLHETETFAEYNTRLGYGAGNPARLVKLDWTTEQNRLQTEYDAKRATELAARVAWTNAVADWTADMAARDAEVLVHNQWMNDFSAWKTNDTLRLEEVAAHAAWVQWSIARTNEQAAHEAWLVYSAERAQELEALAQWETNLVESIVFIPEAQTMITNMVHIGAAPVVRAETPEPTVRAEQDEPTVRPTVTAPVEPSVRLAQAEPADPGEPRLDRNIRRTIPALLKAIVDLQ